MSTRQSGSNSSTSRALTKAQHEGALLVLDEVSFLATRDRATRTWEVSFVNELLRQMERFRGVLVCTTNRLPDLDVACVRRFVQKVRFELPDADRCALLYRQLLAPLAGGAADGEVERAARALAGELAPGDFRLVRDRFALEAPGSVTHAALLDALAGEARIKREQARSRPAGFVPAGR